MASFGFILFEILNSMKRQNDRILKEKLPRSVGVQYATGEERMAITKSSIKNEVAGDKAEMVLIWGYVW